MLKKSLLFCSLLLTAFLFSSQSLAQGVTTAAISGTITDANGEALPGATVLAVHTPSGTQYGTATRPDGRYNFPAVRVGGPYTITVTFVGYQEQKQEGINLALGQGYTADFKLSDEATQLSEVEIIGSANPLLNSERTGAGTNISQETINSLPTLSRSISDFTRLTPQSSGNSFGGQDNRFNNITIDGSIFNNSFGLSGQPGGRTGVAPISLDAIEEIQVNLAPYDVRQSGFTGAGINAVTRSGTNEFSGSVFYNLQNENLVGDQAQGRAVPTNNFQNQQFGFRLGGPILKNKLFFFVNGEFDRRTDPGTTFRANRGGESEGGNITRVLASDLDSLSDYLLNNFGYETGPYEGYDFGRNSDKFLVKLDYNISNNHKLSVRYTSLDAEQDLLVSNSSSLGFGNRRTRVQSLNFANSNYKQLEKIQSVIGELNSNFGGKFSNNFIIGYTYQNEDRAAVGQFFPLVEILEGNQNYTTFGFEPFTPNNRLSYSTFQVQDNFTYYAGAHTVTAGVNVERFSFENVFFPGSQSVYVYNSLSDFYADANGYLENPNRSLTPITTGAGGEPDTLELRRFELRYSALPGGAEPVQPTKVTYAGVYLQDEWQTLPNLKITGGIRIDVPFFEETGLENPIVSAITFQDANGSPVRTNTTKLPDPRILWSPRLGFNWDVKNDRTLQVRGGTGIFTGRPAFVWISNQIGNNGVLTGFDQRDNNETVNRPFNPDPAAYIPSEINFPPAEIATTDEDFKFPQIWRTNLAVDKSLVAGIVGTLEFIYNRNVNAINYLNVNQRQPTGNFSGIDNRSRFPGSQFTSRLDTNIVNNIYLTNTNKGYAYSITAQLEKPFNNGFFARIAYNFGESKDLINAGSIATGSWNGNQTVNGNNRPELAYSSNDQRHRVIGSVSYRKEYGGFGATQIALFYEARNQGRYTYTYSGDMNGDGVNGNDLVYIPQNTSEMRFLPINFTPQGQPAQTLFTPEQQAQAFEAYIQQDDYLRDNRGGYAERNGGLLPWIFQADLSLIQEFFINVGGKRNTLQLRGDAFNIGNLLNSNWGVGTNIINSQPLAAAGTAADGTPQFRFATQGSGANQTVLRETFLTSANLNDVWRAQIGVRYIFN